MPPHALKYLLSCSCCLPPLKDLQDFQNYVGVILSKNRQKTAAPSACFNMYSYTMPTNQLIHADRYLRNTNFKIRSRFSPFYYPNGTAIAANHSFLHKTVTTVSVNHCDVFYEFRLIPLKPYSQRKLLTAVQKTVSFKELLRAV